MENYLDNINDFILNPYTNIKKQTFLEYITILENYQFNNLQDIKIFFNKFYNKIKTKILKQNDLKLLNNIYRKIIINNSNEDVVNLFILKHHDILFFNSILLDEDYVLFKDVFLENINYRNINKLDKFKYFSDFIKVHYKNNNIKENNKLLSKIFILNDNHTTNYYLDIINEYKLDYTLEAFLFSNNNNFNKQNSYLKKINIIEDTIDKLFFLEVNKLSLTKFLKIHGISLFTILVLIKCIKFYKVQPPNYNLVLELIKDEYYYNEYVDTLVKDYFNLCFKKNLYQPSNELLNICAKNNIKSLFINLIDNHLIKPTDDILDIIIYNIVSNDIDLLEKILEMKFILKKEHIKYIFEKSKFNNKLAKLLINNNYIELNNELFEDYIKYENYYFYDGINKYKNDIINKKLTYDKKYELYLKSEWFKKEIHILNNFIIDKNKYDYYFNIIHKYNKSNNYDLFLDFIINKLLYKKKEIKHILEFTKRKYKFNIYMPNLHKNNIDIYLSKCKLKITKLSIDMCMKAGNYESGIYLIEKLNIKPDITTLLFIKDIDNRIELNKKVEIYTN